MAGKDTALRQVRDALEEAQAALNGAPNTQGLHSQIDAALRAAHGELTTIPTTAGHSWAHTPGPWSSDEYEIATPYGSNRHIRSEARHWSVCVVHEMRGCTDPSKDISAEEARANARLIAAAPDMYEALQNARGLIDTPVARRKHQSDPFYDGVVASLRAALAKATGENV